MNTKERILQETLNLFSSHGFEAVSMRDIGAAVGIRESSIYKHYAGKQAIMDAIVERAIQEIEALGVAHQVPDSKDEVSVARYESMEIEDVASLCTTMMMEQRKNEFLAKFRQLLTIEQYRNEKLKKLYIDIYVKRQLDYNEKVFEHLLSVGILEGSSAKTMAMQFYSPFFMLQFEYPNDNETLESILKEYVVSFIKEHLKGDVKQ